jgi:hypothetical protein
MYIIVQSTIVWKPFLEAGNCKYKILTKSDVDFYNIMFIGLFNYMCVNGTLHIMHAVMIKNKIGG